MSPQSLRPVVCLLLTILASAPALAGVEAWTGNGPFEAGVLDLAVDPEDPHKIYAGTLRRGLLRSLDGGESWSRVAIDADLPGQAIENVVAVKIDAEDPRRLFALSSGLGLARSLDGGATWARLDVGFRSQFGVLTVAIRDPGVVYVASRGGDLARSLDGGSSWTSVGSGLRGEIRALVNDPFAPEGLVAATSNGIYRSPDRGATFSRMNALIASALIADPQDPGIFYAGVDGRGVFLSLDGGQSFDQILEFPNSSGGDLDVGALAVDPLPSVPVDPVPPPTLYVGSATTVWRTFDRGGSWRRFDRAVAGTTSDIDAGQPGSGPVYAATSVGIWRSDDGGEQWRSMSNGLDDSTIEDLVVAPSDPRVLYAVSEDGFIQRSDDAGASWQPLKLWFSARRFRRLVVDPGDASRVWAVNGDLYFSADSGLSWRRIDTGIENLFALELALDPAGDILYLATFEGLWKSTDNGATWLPSGAGLPANEFVNSITVDPHEPRNLYVTVLNTGLFRSFDGGASWLPSDAGLPGAADRLWADPLQPGTLYVSFARFDVVGLWKSSDGGVTWSSAGLADVSRVEDLALDRVEPGVLWAATARDGMFRSLDGGSSWAPFDSALPGLARRLAAHPSVPGALWAGTRPRGVFFRLSAENETLELRDGRFEATLDWRDSSGNLGTGKVAAVSPVPRLDDVALASSDTAVVEFFSRGNWEMIAKVLDGRAINDHFWVFLAAATDAGYTVEVTDTSCGLTRVYRNRSGTASPAVTDTLAFPGCAAPAPPDCTADDDALCLGEGDRFRVEVAWDDGRGGLGVGEQARLERAGAAASEDSGLFYFFSAENWELLVKVLDGCAINGHFWVFGAATTDVEYTLTVTDTEGGGSAVYRNPLGTAASAINDTAAFATCGM